MYHDCKHGHERENNNKKKKQDGYFVKDKKLEISLLILKAKQLGDAFTFREFLRMTPACII